MDSEIDLLINLWQQERCLWDASTPLYGSGNHVFNKSQHTVEHIR